MPAARVKELARDSRVTLSPVSAAAVDEDWRGQIADYLLQQQSGAESTATKGHLRRSEGARAWSRSVLDSLDQFYDPANLPTIPDGDGGPPPRTKPVPKPKREHEPPSADKPVEPAEERKELSPEATTLVRRRQIAAGAALALLALLALLVWPIGLLTGDHGDDDSRQARRPAPRVVGQLLLQPVEGARGTGVAVIAARARERQLIVQARLPASRNREAYEVWLYNSDRDARSLGAQVTDDEGRFQGAGPLPGDVTRYRFIDISRERVDRNDRHSGRSVLRGRVDQFQRPAAGAQGTGTTPDRQTTP